MSERAGVDRAAIRATLIKLMEDDIGESFADLDESKNLRDDLGLDSVDLVSVVSQIERHFRVRLSQQDLESIATPGHLLDLLEARLNVAQAA